METGLKVLLAWSAFALIHSLTASDRYKDSLSALLGTPRFRAYHKLAYTALSVATFSLLVLYLRTLPDRPLYSIDTPWRLLFRGGQLLSVALILATPLDLSGFLGIRQALSWLRQGADAPSDPPPRLFTGITYAIVRHPLYLGCSGAVLFQPDQTLVSAFSAVAVVLYFVVGSVHEERRLVREFGEVYREYQRKVPRMIPFRFPK